MNRVACSPPVTHRSLRLAWLAAALLCLNTLLPAADPSADSPPAANEPPRTPHPSPESRTDFSSFRLVTERNIFNSRRSGRTRERTREPERSIPVESIRLVGTLQADAGAKALFDGTSPEYRRALRCGETLAGFTLAAVDGRQVRLVNGTNQVDLTVGMQLRRTEDQPWEIGEGGTTPASTGSTPSDSRQPSAPATSGPSEPINDDALKRLLERRQKEMQ